MPTLQYRRYRGDMIELFKFSHDYYDQSSVKEYLDFTPKSCYNLRRHELSLYKEKATKQVRRNAFKNRVVDQWNSLPSSIVTAVSMNSFKNQLDKLWKKNDVMFDNECDFVQITSSRQTRFEY